MINKKRKMTGCKIDMSGMTTTSSFVFPICLTGHCICGITSPDAVAGKLGIIKIIMGRQTDLPIGAEAAIVK